MMTLTKKPNESQQAFMLRIAALFLRTYGTAGEFSYDGKAHGASAIAEECEEAARGQEKSAPPVPPSQPASRSSQAPGPVLQPLGGQTHDENK